MWFLRKEITANWILRIKGTGFQGRMATYDQRYSFSRVDDNLCVSNIHNNTNRFIGKECIFNFSRNISLYSITMII